MTDLTLIGRDEEKKVLEQFVSENEAGFLAIYGRRRVGKTFIIRSFFIKKNNIIFFNSTGAQKALMKQQIKNFTQEIGNTFFYEGAKLAVEKNWDDTFQKLTEAIQKVKENKKIVLFFDEFPWMTTRNSRLLQNLEYYWNHHWSRDSRIKLIICGSSASWIIEKILKNKGGLHNRVTHQIFLEPFDLRNTQLFLRKKGIKLNNKQILQLYMAIGGIPFYLSKVEKGYSATQIIERLAFRKKGFLLKEFDNLFASLFENHEAHIDILRKIAKHRYGIGQEKILKTLEKSLRGEAGIRILKNLKDSGFISSFKPIFSAKKGIYYRLIDEYTLFYFRWIEPVQGTLLEHALAKGYWEKIQKSPAWNSWAGYTFESICYHHLQQIFNALQMSPTAIPGTWRYSPRKQSKEKGAQIDLLFDRDDGAITVCEIKYSQQAYSIDKEYANKLNNKIAVFKKISRTKKQIFLSLISSNGLKPSIYSEEMVDGVVTLDDLFKKE